MQNVLVENCRKWIANYLDGNFYVTSNHLRLQAKIDHVRILGERLDELDLEVPSTNALNKFERIRDAIMRHYAEVDVDGELNQHGIELMRYATQATVIDSEIKAKLANVSAEIRMLVRAWMEQNWDSRYSSWGPLFAILMEDGTTPVQKAMSGKPALSALFDRLSYRRWETIDSNDERNIQRLTEILLQHGIEIERPRGERKARLKKLSN